MLIIVEGRDNTGKDFFIGKIKEYFKVLGIPSIEYHFIKPYQRNLSSQENESYQQFQYFSYILTTIRNFSLYNNVRPVIHILNRSYLGEYVYAPLYRGDDKTDVHNKIISLESKFQQILFNQTTYLYLLDNSCQEDFQEDITSPSEKNKIENERKLFSEIFQHTIIPHKRKVTTKNNIKWVSEVYLNQILDLDFKDIIFQDKFF